MAVYYDNTRISSYKECPRKYYLRHVRHFRGEGTAIPLVFGLAWHEAMNVMWALTARTDKSIEEITQLSYLEWERKWCEMGLSSMDEMTDDENSWWSPRTPNTALEMLWNYATQRRDFIKECESVVSIERPFAVPIYPNNTSIMYVGRLDKEVKIDGKVRVIEHKTTTAYKRDGGFRDDYIRSFSPNSQVDGYSHAGHMLHGDEAKGVYVDAALVHKDVHDKFKFIPISRQTSMLDAWLHDTQDWINRIESEKANLRTFRQNPDAKNYPYFPLFPKNTESCYGKYGACGYVDICQFISNPESRYAEGEAPDGFIIEKWEPFEVLELEKIGLEKEDKV